MTNKSRKRVRENTKKEEEKITMKSIKQKKKEILEKLIGYYYVGDVEGDFTQERIELAISALTELDNGLGYCDVCSQALKEKVGKVQDSLMYDFPKSYTNAQILAYQKAIEKVGIAISKMIMEGIENDSQK